jgi:hypothetical protein
MSEQGPPVPPESSGPSLDPAQRRSDAVGRLRARRAAPSASADQTADAPVEPAAPDTEPVAAERDVEVPAEPAVAEAPAATAPVATSPRSRPAVGLLVAVVIAVLAAGLLTATTLKLSDRDRTVSDRTAATAARGPIVAAATQELKATLSYDYRHLPSDFATAERGLTPSFRADYVHDTKNDVSPAATQYHVVVTANVDIAGIVSNTATSGRLLVFFDQTTANTQLSAPRLDRYRANVTMLRQHGKWLLNSITPL